MPTVVTVGDNAKLREAFTEVRATAVRKISSTTQNSADTSAMANEEPYSLVGKCFAEFIAVMIFVIIGSFQALTEFDGVLHAALAHGIAIFVLVSCFAHISGGHVNPAVTFGIALAGKIKWLEAGLYIVAQLLGGLVGSLLVRLWLTRESYVSIQGGATLCAANVTMFQGCAVEIATTFCLVQTVLLTAVDSATVLAPLAIGLTVAMDIFAVGGISGASMNPGRSFGPNVVATIFMHEELAENFWSHHWIYYVGPICGAALASGLYRLFFAKSGRMV